MAAENLDNHLNSESNRDITAEDFSSPKSLVFEFYKNNNDNNPIRKAVKISESDEAVLIKVESVNLNQGLIKIYFQIMILLQVNYFIS